MVRRKPNVAILNSPIYSANEGIFLDKHIRILRTLCNRIFVITGNYPFRYGRKVRIIEIETERTRAQNTPLLVRIVHQMKTQIKLTLQLLRLRRKLDLVFLDIGEYHNVLPLLFSRLLKKKTLVFQLGGDKILESWIENFSGVERILPIIESILLSICYRLVDNILCISPSIIQFGNLKRYERKIVIYGGEYIDTNRFRIRTRLVQKRNLVGYAGRLARKKGLINFVRAMPLVLRAHPDVRFLISGSGDQKEEIIREVEKKEVGDKVDLCLWIPDQEFPQFLNRIKVFVLPSYEEGVPVTLMEAMASGAIVLTTPVGGIPDVVQDGKTGFIMPNNTPHCIAKSILRVLNDPRLDQIVRNARSLVEKQASFHASVKQWEYILKELRF